MIPSYMPAFVHMGMGKTVLLPNLYSVMWREVIVLLWDAIKSVSVRIAKGESTYIINCTDWNNAFKRVIVLHSYDLVPATDIYPVHLPLGISQGCPVICNDVMRKVDKLLKGEAKPVLLWSYC